MREGWSTDGDTGTECPVATDDKSCPLGTGDSGIDDRDPFEHGRRGSGERVLRVDG